MLQAPPLTLKALSSGPKTTTGAGTLESPLHTSVMHGFDKLSTNILAIPTYLNGVFRWPALLTCSFFQHPGAGGGTGRYFCKPLQTPQAVLCLRSIVRQYASGAKKRGIDLWSIWFVD